MSTRKTTLTLQTFKMRAVDENAEKGSGELSHGDKGEVNSKDRTVHEELTKRGTQKVPPIAQTVGT